MLAAHAERQGHEQRDPPQHEVDRQPGRDEIGHCNNPVCSGLLDFDQGAGKILWMQEQHRLAMGADLGLAIPEHPRPFLDQGVPRGNNIGDLVADMMNTAIGIALEEFRDRRGLAERLDELDLGVGQGHEHGDDAVLGQRHRRRNLRTERCAINPGSLVRVLDGDGHMIEPAQHCCPPFLLTQRGRFNRPAPYTCSTCTTQIGFLPQCSLTTDLTVRRTDSAIASGSRRRARGRLSNVETTASNTMSSISSPAIVFSGMPTISSSGSPASSPLSLITIATKTQPANAILRRSPTARDLASSTILPSL